MGQVKITTKVQAFKDVNKSLQDIQKNFNELFKAVNTNAEGIASEAQGKSGDLKVTKNADGTFNLECNTSDGWKKMFVGDAEVLLKDRAKVKSKPTVAKKLSSADYDSGWVEDAANDAAITLNHKLETQNFSLMDLRAAQSASGSNTTWIMFAMNHQSGGNIIGYIVQIADDNNVKVGTGPSGSPKFQCAGLSGEDTNFTHFRLRLWK